MAVLSQVCLNIHEGEFVALIGPSGSDKNTLLNVIGLLDRRRGAGRREANEIESRGMPSSGRLSPGAFSLRQKLKAGRARGLGAKRTAIPESRFIAN